MSCLPLDEAVKQICPANLGKIIVAVYGIMVIFAVGIIQYDPYMKKTILSLAILPKLDSEQQIHQNLEGRLFRRRRLHCSEHRPGEYLPHGDDVLRVRWHRRRILTVSER